MAVHRTHKIEQYAVNHNHKLVERLLAELYLDRNESRVALNCRHSAVVRLISVSRAQVKLELIDKSLEIGSIRIG